MNTGEKAAHIARQLENHRAQIERQSRLLAELKRRMDPDAPAAPKLGLKTLEEVRAYVESVASGRPFR